jgi:hypothetical protein
MVRLAEIHHKIMVEFMEENPELAQGKLQTANAEAEYKRL